MNEAAEKRFKRQVLSILQAEHTDIEGGWMGPLEVLTKLGHGTPGEVNRAVDALVSAGLAERYAGTTHFRSRGTTATRGIPTEALSQLATKTREERREELTDILAEVLYDRGHDTRQWPEDEAEAYREAKGLSFTHANEVVTRLRLSKAADAIIKAGWRKA